MQTPEASGPDLDLPSAGPERISAVYVAQVMRSLGREVQDVARARTPVHARLRDILVAIVVATAGIDLICAALALLFEHRAQHTDITNFGAAIFWTSTQLLTVSSSIRNPITTGGKILDIAMEAYAITVIATLAGALGAYILRRGRELEQAQAPGAAPPQR